MGLFRFIIRRILTAIFVLFGILVITFILSHSIGGNPIVAWLGKYATLHPQLVQEYATEYHLNDPLWLQFFYYIGGLLQGNWGISPSRGFTPVLVVIGQTLPYTIQIVFFATVISIILGLLLGVVSAKYHHKSVDGGIRVLYLAGISSPSFLMALALLILFTFVFHILPTSGIADPYVPQPTPISGLPILDSLIELNFAYFVSAMSHVILPAMALALTTFGIIVRLLRSSLLDVMRSNYIRTARAKGLTETSVFFKHGLRNAIISTITFSSIIVIWLFTGTIFVENIFAYPGIGEYVFTALSSQDYPGVLGATIIFAIIIVSLNLFADILYAVADPQIRLG